MIEEMEHSQLQPPEFAETEQTFTVTLRNNIEIRRLRRQSGLIQQAGFDKWTELTTQQKQALEFASRQKEVYTRSFAQYIDRSRNSAQTILDSLVKLGLLEKIETKPKDPKTHFRLKDWSI